MTDFLSNLNFENSPQIILISFIFLFQFISKRRELTQEFNEEEKKKADSLFWKYMIIFQLAKSADWCLGPFNHEFFSEYHSLNLESIARLTAISFATNLFIGPSLIGYLNDQENKKFPCLFYGFTLGLSCLLRQYKNNLSFLIMSQVCFGISNSLLYTSFENWFVNEANKTIKDKPTKDYLFSAAFEKSMISDSFTAVFVSFIAGYLKSLFGITAPYIFSIFLCTLNILSLVFIIKSNGSETTDIKNEVEEKKNEKDSQ